MMKLFKIAFLPLLAGILLLPAASRPVRAAGSAAVEAGAGDRKRDKKKKQEADTAAKATPYEKLFKDKRVETVRGGGLTLHLTADKLYLELPDSLLGRGLMITTTIEWTGDPGDGLAHQQPVPPYMVEFGRGKSDTLLCMREFAPVVIVDGSPAMREAVGRSNIGPIVASYAVKARTPDGKSSVVDVTALFVGDVKRLRPIDPEGGNTYGGWMTAKADYKKDRSMLTGVTGGKGCVSVVGELSYGTTVSFLGLLDLWKDKPQSIVARRTLRVLGDPERRMRLCDQRLGLAAKAFKRFSDREQEAKTDYYVCRRSILDSAGKVRPVVFYVDTAFDASAYAAVERGLLLWNDAFAKIGCKDVVRVEPFPADPAFNDNSLYNNCVRRTGTSNSELYTASWVDPRSGEILGTDIFVPFNFTAAIQKKLLLTLSAADPEGGNTYGGWMTAKADYKKDRSMLTGVTGGKGCVSVVGELSYGTTVSFLGLLDLWKDKPQSIVARRTLRVLGDPERRMRLCDQRLGLAAKAFKRFSDREQEAKTDYYVCRRSILDSAGKVRPVVFYVDTAFDASAYAAVERGLLLWNDAFAKIGCKDVVRVEPFPADPAFNDNSLYNNCVRRTGTSNSELYTASWVDPRSGEILGTDIFVPFNFTAAIQKKLLLTLSAADPEARTTQPSARQIADALTAMVARRAASAFGVMPNYAASSAYLTDSLRSPSFTRENGLAASITDDVFYNIVAQPGDRERGVKLVADALGPYDYLAVEWLYKPVPGAVTPHDEVPELRRLLASKEGDPRCFFAQYASGTYDPRVGAGDLGDDLFRSVALQSANLKYVAEHGDGWLSGRDGDYKFREELLTEMVLRVNSLALQLMRYIGGVYMNPVYEGTARPACTAVPREVQRRALREALALTADLGWIDRQGVSKNVYNRVQACEYLQRRIARTLLEKLGTLGLAASKADDPYTADLMAKDLVAWFEERLRSREPLTDHVRNLQQSLLKSTVAAANVKDKPSSGSGSAFALFDGSGSLSDGGDLFPATDAGALPDMPAERRADDFTPLGAGEVQGAAYGYRTPRVIPAFREHLFYGLLLDMKAMYRRGAASAPLADTRSFCRYMADRIDRELAVE